MFGECHAHIFLNGRNYKEAVALHKNHVSEEAIRQVFAEYRKRGITFVRDGGDALHVSEYASKIAPQYGIDYRSPMFAIHRKGHYGRIVGCAWEDLEEYRDLVKKVKDLGGDFIKIMISGIMVYEQFGQMSEEPLAPEESRELIHIAHEDPGGPGGSSPPPGYQNHTAPPAQAPPWRPRPCRTCRSSCGG